MTIPRISLRILFFALSIHSMSLNAQSTLSTDSDRIFVMDENVECFQSIIQKKSLPNLKALVLRLDKIPKNFMLRLEKLRTPELQDFWLYAISQCPWKMLTVKAFSNLRSLTFRSMSIPQVPPNQHIVFSFLEKLNINDCNIRDLTVLKRWRLPQVKEIRISRHVELQSLHGIQPFLKTLTTLSFSNMGIESFEGLTYNPLPKLKHLEINARLTPKAWQELSALDLKHLEHLELAYLKNRGAQGAQEKKQSANGSIEISLTLPNLLKLTMIYYTGPILNALKRFHMPKLRVLDLQHSEISIAELEQIQKYFGPNIRIIHPGSKK